MKHILICGERHAGKTTLIEKLKKEITAPISGFTTKIIKTRADGFHEIYMFPSGLPEMTEENGTVLAQCDTVKHEVCYETFETLGVRLLKAEPNGVIIMDELGFMETAAPSFCSAVIKCFDGETPVLATIKAGFENNSFLNAVKKHPNLELFNINVENRDELFDSLLPIIRKWNSR